MLGNIDPLKKTLRQPLGRKLCYSLFGTTKSREVFENINALCADVLGAEIEDVLYARANVALPVGVKLTTGERVALKFHLRNGVNDTHFQILQGIQKSLWKSGIPVPQPLAPAEVTDRAIVIFDSMLSLPKPVDMRPRKNRQALATELARFVQVATNCAGGRKLKSLKHERFSVTTSDPTSPFAAFDNHRFSLKKTESKARWLNELAVTSIEQASGVRSPIVVGHFDWRIENVRLRSGEVTAIIDFDAIAAAPEFEVVATSAAIHSLNYEGKWGSAPTPRAMTDFIETYEAERGRTFSDRERRAIGAAGTWALASVARRELVGDPNNRRLAGSCREVLLRYGSRYLEV